MNSLVSQIRTRFDPRSPAHWQGVFLSLTLVAGYLSIAVSQITLGLALAAMLYRWLVGREAPPPTGLEKSAALLALWALIMVPLSTDVGQSALYYRRFYLFAAIWIAAGLATGDRRRLLLLVMLLAGASASSLWAQIGQWRQYGNLLDHRLTEIFNAMTGGALLMMAVQVAVGFLLAPGLSRRLKLVVGVVALPVALGLLMTMTRSAMLGLMVGLIAMLLVIRPRTAAVFVGLLAVGITVLAVDGENLVSDRMWSRINPRYVLSGGNTVARLDMWRGGWQIVKAHPWTGVGDRGLEEISPRYYTSVDGRYFGHLHSNPVQMAVIWGLPGLALGQFFLWAGLWVLVRRWLFLRSLAVPGPDLAVRRGWVLGAIGVWASFYVAGFTDWYFGDAEAMLIYLAILGCALGRDATAA